MFKQAQLQIDLLNAQTTNVLATAAASVVQAAAGAVDVLVDASKKDSFKESIKDKDLPPNVVNIK